MSDSKAAFSIPSIIAVVAAILSFKAAAIMGLILAIVAIAFGLLGVLLSLSPRTRGGMVSIFGILAGLVGIVAAIVKAIQYFSGGA